MNIHRDWLWRPSGVAVIASLALPTLLAGCGSPAPPAAPIARQPVANRGMSTGQKVKLLAGAAALYYLYNRYKKQNAAQLANQKVQYYLSKNGRVYYRDPQNPRNVIYVTPPPSQVGTINVPNEEAASYSGIQGYENAQSGKTLRDFFPVG